MRLIGRPSKMNNEQFDGFQDCRGCCRRPAFDFIVWLSKGPVWKGRAHSTRSTAQVEAPRDGPEDLQASALLAGLDRAQSVPVFRRRRGRAFPADAQIRDQPKALIQNAEFQIRESGKAMYPSVICWTFSLFVLFPLLVLLVFDLKDRASMLFYGCLFRYSIGGCVLGQCHGIRRQ